ncbi:MAG: glycerophosphodiester phosphodiesterase [Eubacteriales bacterium]|nr:glycerophosphodiester phosphodiesterase [Eubacteriales bacterium]
MKKWVPAALAATGAYLYSISPRLSERPARLPQVYYAHRGLHDNLTDAPENSLAAFEKAAEAGYGIELDVQLTRDGQVVVVHDFSLKRLCQVDRPVDSFTYEELQELPIYGSSQRIPLFAEVLKLVAGRVPLIVELKYKNGSKICEKAQEILNGYTGVYCVESFHPQVLRWYRQNYPHICRGQLSMNYQREDGSRGAQFFVMRHLLTNFLTRPDFIAYDCRAMHAVSKTICRNLFGCPLVAWTVKCQAQLDACRKHFDYFIFEGFVPRD